MVGKVSNLHINSGTFIIVGILIIFILGGCFSTGEQDIENVNVNSSERLPALPSLENIFPNDPYLFLPLEDVGFQLIFTEAVDTDLVERAISFEPKVDFIIQSSRNSKEFYLYPQEKLQSDTSYTLQIDGVHNVSTGNIELLEFTYRTEFQAEKQITNLQWSNDGKELLYLVKQKESNSADLWKMNVDDKNEQLLASELSWSGRASWSPDDNSILFTKMVLLSEEGYSYPEVRSIDRQSHEQAVIVSADELAHIAPYAVDIYCWWSPDGEKIILQVNEAGIDAHSDIYRSIFVADSTGETLHAVDGQIFVGWQKNDKLMVLKTHESYNNSRAFRYDMFLVDTDGGTSQTLLLGKGQIFNFDRASQSLNLDNLVFSQWESVNTISGFKNIGTELLLYDVARNFLTPIGLEEGYQEHPAISADGTKIAFSANKDGYWNLYLYENGITTQLTDNRFHSFHPAWSHDGQKLAFVSTDNGTEQISILSLQSYK